MGNTDKKSLDGWVKLYRSLLGGTVFAEPRLLKVFIWCLLKANKEDGYQCRVGKQVITLQRGQFITGRNMAAEELGMSPSAVRRWLCELQNGQQISLSANNKFTLVTVVNYGLYQSGKVVRGQRSGQQDLLSADNKADTYKKNNKKSIQEEKTRSADAPLSSETERMVPDPSEGWGFD